MKIGRRRKIKMGLALRWAAVLAQCGLAAASALWPSACGSTAATGSDGASETLQVTGTVQVPTITTSSSLAKSVGSKAVSDATASGLTCALYTLDGTKIGEATSASDGTFTIAATLTTLKGSATGTSWTKTVESVCKDTSGAIEVRSYQELTVVEGTTTTVAVGTIDSTSTLAAAAMELAHQDASGTVGCEPSTGQSCSPVSAATDVSCLFAADQTVWKQTSTTGSGSVDDLGWVLSTFRAAQAGGLTPSQLGEENWGKVLRTLRRNELSAAAMTQIATAVASTLGSDVEDLEIFLTTGVAVAANIRTVLTETLAGNVGTTAIGDSTPCALGEANTTYMQALVTPLLGTDDARTITTVYGTGDAWSSWAKTLNQATDANYNRFLNRFAGVHSFLAERYTNQTLSTWDAEDAILLYNVLALDFFSGSDVTASAEAGYLKGWANLDAGTCVITSVWDVIRGKYVDAH